MIIEKYIKKIIVFACSASFIFNAGCVLAYDEQEQQAEEVFDKTNLQEKKDIEDVKSVLKQYLASEQQADEGDSRMLAGESVAGKEIYDYEKAYCVTGVDLLMITEFQKKGDFSKLLTGKRQWKVPYQTKDGEKGLVTLEEKGDSWEWLCESADDEMEKIPPDKEQIVQLIGEQMDKGENIIDITYAHSMLYSMTMIYVQGEQNDYIIPYAETPQQLNLEAEGKGIVNGTLYTDKKFIFVMNRLFDENQLKENGNLNGGIPYREEKAFSWELISISVLLVVILGYFVMRTVKKQNLPYSEEREKN